MHCKWVDFSYCWSSIGESLLLTVLPRLVSSHILRVSHSPVQNYFLAFSFLNSFSSRFSFSPHSQLINHNGRHQGAGGGAYNISPPIHLIFLLTFTCFSSYIAPDFHLIVCRPSSCSTLTVTASSPGTRSGLSLRRWPQGQRRDIGHHTTPHQTTPHQTTPLQTTS